MNHSGYYSVSRIEGGIAVLECPDRTFAEFALSDLPDSVKEGSILVKKAEGGFEIESEEEKRRKAKFFELQNKIFGKK